MASEIIRLWMRDPLDDEPESMPVRQSTREEAQLRAASIRATLTRFLREAAPKIAEAYRARDWVVMDYGTWADYVRGEFGIDRLKFDDDVRRDGVSYFHLMGMSNRAIASTLGVRPATVQSDLAAKVIPGEAREVVLGADGKQYPAHQPDKVAPDGVIGAPSDASRAAPPADGPAPAAIGDGSAAGPSTVASPAVDGPVVPEREREWPAQPEAGGAVTSATPGNPSDEAPAPAPAEVEYRAWRERTDNILRELRSNDLPALTGDYDATTFAQQATDAQVDALTELAERLTTFVSEVRAQRGPTREVYMSTTRRGLDYHRPGRHEQADDGPYRMTVCDRSMRTGVVISRKEALGRYDAKPCRRCWPEGDD